MQAGKLQSKNKCSLHMHGVASCTMQAASCETAKEGKVSCEARTKSEFSASAVVASCETYRSSKLGSKNKCSLQMRGVASCKLQHMKWDLSVSICEICT